MAEPFIGSIHLGAFNFAPRGYAFCSGQILSIAQNTALFSLLGTTYGGNGQTTFALPDLRGRVPVHAGSGPGLTNRNLGESSGALTHTLTVNEIPAHTHGATVGCASGNGTANTPVNNIWSKDLGTKSLTYSTSAPDANMGPGITVSNAGGSQPHENRQPYLAINFYIALEGIFPSRN